MQKPVRLLRIDLCLTAWPLLVCCLLRALKQVHGQCAYNVGVDANTYGVTATEQMYYPTFQTYLSAETGCTFTMTLFTSPDLFVAAGLNGSVDVFFAGPGVFVCLQSQLGTVPLASLINEVNGKPLSWLAGSAVAKANRTDLQTLEDINNQRLTLSGISTLTSGQAQWRELKDKGYNPFILAEQVIFLHDQQAQMLAVVDGTADVAFVRADQPATLAAEGVISLDEVKILSPMTFPGFPWTTSTRLYPEYGLSANPRNVPLDIQEAIVEALYAIDSSHYAAVAGHYNSWSTPYNYLDAYQMQLDTNVLVNGSCLAQNDTYDMVVCPASSYKLPANEINGLCAERGLPCPVNASCICNFCKPIPHTLFGHLGFAGFLAVVIVGVIILMIVAFLVVRANRLTVMHIPFSELHLSDESEVLGEGVHGKVLRGEYRGTQVAVKRMLAPRHSRTKSIFDAEIIRPSRQSQENIITLRDSQRLNSDLIIDIMAHASAAPASSDRSVTYSPGQHFLLTPGSGLDLNKPLPSIQSVQSAETNTHLLKGSQSPGPDNQAVDKDQGEYLLAAAPTTQNLKKLQEHESAAEELQAQDLIGAHPAASPRSTFWGEESRLDMEYDESRRQFGRAGYHESRNWQDVWHAFTSWMACAWACVGAHFLCGPIKAHLGREAALQQTVVALRLRHPHIVTVMGTSVDPPTKDLLLVTALLQRGTLYDLLHNDTVMLDNEMIVSMLRHVVAGLSFLHSAEPSIIHQELRSPKVLLDSSCRAHLSDFQQRTVRP
ncbi:TPA: hypothetical protein ACH3X1_002887 [Trebouxia sp. C0004]